MNGYVLDCSVAVCWIFKEQATPGTDRLFDRMRHEGTWVPALWHLELSNILARDERRGRITADQVTECLGFLERFLIATDEENTPRVWNEVLTLARAEKLTTYDAAYLELALRKGLPLATKDEDLIEAAQRSGVAVLPK